MPDQLAGLSRYPEVWIVVVCVAFLLALTAALTRDLDRRKALLIEEAFVNVAAHSGLLRRSISEMLQSGRLLLELSSRGLSDVDGAAGHIRQLRGIGTGAVLGIAVVNAEGAVIAYSDAKAVFSHVGATAEFQRLKDGSPYVLLKPSAVPETGMHVIPLLKRLESEQGRFLGAIAVSFNPEYLLQLFEAAVTGARDSVVLADMDGTIYARRSIPTPGRSVRPGETVKGLGLVRAAQTAPRGNYTVDSAIDGLKRLGGYEVFDDSRLVIGVTFPEEDVLSSYYQRRPRVLAFGGVIGGAVILSAFVSVRAIRRNRAMRRRWERERSAHTEEKASLRSAYSQNQVALAHSADALGQVTYALAHDLRAPLRAIDGMGGILLEEYGTQLDAEGQGYVERMRRAARSMGMLADGLLRFSSIANTKLEFTTVNLSRLANDVWESLHHVKTDARLVIGPEIVVVADRKQMWMLFEQVFDNTRRFSSPERVRHVEVGMTRTEWGRTVFIRDNGVGFDGRFADALFRPFSRLHQESGQSGPGMGLASAKRIVEHHGGRIWATSELGRETTVYFTLSTASVGGALLRESEAQPD